MGPNWTCCSGKVPKEEIVYFCQFSTLFVLILFCMIKLATDTNIENIYYYRNILCFTIGTIIPAPSINRPKRNQNNITSINDDERGIAIINSIEHSSGSTHVPTPVSVSVSLPVPVVVPVDVSGVVPSDVHSSEGVSMDTPVIVPTEGGMYGPSDALINALDSGSKGLNSVSRV